MDRMDMMNATLEEEAKRKARDLHVRVVVGLKKEAHKKMLRISKQRLGQKIFHLLQHGGWEEMSLELKPLSTSWISTRKSFHI